MDVGKIRKAKSELGYRLRVDLKTGLRLTTGWYKREREGFLKA